MKVSFSLSKPKQVEATTSTLKTPAVFLADDETLDITSAPADHGVSVNKKLLAQNAEATRGTKRRTDTLQEIDPTVYEYDEVWDRMQEVKLRQKEVKEMDALQRKPKYIHGLLASAATRKLDHLRAEEKMMQLEREAEGDEFKDKEVFVTQAYKDQMAEVRRAEEEEKKREELRKKGNLQSTGMTHFYRKLLEESEQNHEFAVAATQKPRIIGPQGPIPNLTILKPPTATQMSDLELAKIAREEGKEVELNDDNQIVDKRELLAAGLNLSAPNTRRLGMGKSSISRVEAETAQHRAVGTAASRREINERRAREIRSQIEAEADKLTRDKQLAEQETLRKVVERRNNENDVQSARERYLERKRRRIEETQDTNSHE